ncbi:NHL repeat containing protein [Candidatus Magnetobacterium bavaricum]|uniref:NHL repeat containing protein n=1 Tax=Candidatus Magnetobacterium bavaricum TaxID=29290 RepID=A0A0F3GUG2_9BACT|nr:NHL repeat containing protein [Candidatus Magnetobacterium bavaricum]
MSAAKRVIAMFTANEIKQYTLSVIQKNINPDSTKVGTIISNKGSINCGDSGDGCTSTYNAGTVVTLTAIDGTDSTFAGWTGCSLVIGNKCTVTMNKDISSVTATFKDDPLKMFLLTMTKTGSGIGVVTISDGTLLDWNGMVGNRKYNIGTTLTLTATATNKSTFAGWSGCDSISDNQCTITFDDNKSVTATFNGEPETYTQVKSFGNTGIGSGQFKSAGRMAIINQVVQNPIMTRQVMTRQGQALSNILLVLDDTLNQIKLFDIKTKMAITPDAGKWGSDNLSKPSGIGVDPSGYVYVSDTGNNRIQKLDSSGNSISKWGGPGSADGEFNSPMGLAVDQRGNVYVSDKGNHRIQKFDSNGKFQTSWSGNGKDTDTKDDTAFAPDAITVDKNGDVYVVDTRSNNIVKYDTEGKLLNQWQTNTLSKFNAITVDNQGDVWAADAQSSTLQKFDKSGQRYKPIELEKTNTLRGLAVDASGNLYLSQRTEDEKHVAVFSKVGETKPLAVTNLTVKRAETGLSLGWNAVSDTTNYKVYYSKTPVSTVDLSSDVLAEPTGAKYDHTTEIANRTDYYYRVRGCNNVGCGAFSNTATYITTPPADLKVESVTGGLRLTWKAVSGAESYKVYFSTTTQVNDSTAVLAEPTDVTYDHTIDVVSGKNYYYSVRACNSAGCGALSETVAYTIKPLAVTGLTVSQVTGGLGLTWDAVSGAESYKVYFSTTTPVNDSTTVLAEPTGATYDHTTAVVSGTNYYYRVRACNSAGCGDLSETVAYVTSPSVVTGLKVTQVTDGLRLVWDAGNNATKYEVYFSKTTPVDVSVKALAESTVATYDHKTEVTNGTNYYYRIRACNSVGCGEFSDTAAYITTPPVVTGLQVSQVTGGLRLTWDAGNNAVSYKVYHGTTSTVNESSELLAEPTGATYDHAGIVTGTHYYSVRACNSGGCGALSDTVAYTVKPLAVTGIKITPITGGLRLVWNAVSDAVSYKVYFGTTTPVDDSSSVLAEPTDATYDHMTAISSVTNYYYRVRACNSGGCGGLSDTAAYTPPSGLKVRRTIKTADLNGDGKSDVVWQNIKNGDVAAWLMDGLNITGGNYVDKGKGIPKDWQMIAKGDLNGDGNSDIVWQNSTTGDVAAWLMNGFTITSGDYLAKGIPSDWQMIAIGDLNGDGKSDLVWQNSTTSDVAAWLMNGFTITKGDYLVKAISSAWQMIAIGDLNGDGKSDLVWQNSTTGDVVAWLMDGLTTTKGDYLARGIHSDWQMVAIGDLNGDGKSDLVWQNTTTGDVVAWLMDGFTTTKGDYLARGISGEWQVIAIGDLNGDKKSDLVWQNINSGDIAAWLMDGLTITKGDYLAKGIPGHWQVK